MEILEGFDLTASLRDASELPGAHRTRWRIGWPSVMRDVGAGPGDALPECDRRVPAQARRARRAVRGKIRADVAHDKIVAMGFGGSERTTRRAVAQIKKAWRSGGAGCTGRGSRSRGCGQYDFGDGPRIGGAATILFCFWLAWCRFRVVVPLLDKTAPSVFAAIDTALRMVGGVPTYLLTDNERTVTVEHVAGIAVRNPGTVAFGRHYGLTAATCVPADPASKGGSRRACGSPRPTWCPRTRTCSRLRQLRRAGGGLRGVHHRDQRAAAPRHPPCPGRDAHPGAGPAASAARDTVHRRVRGDPHGRRQHPDGQLRALQYSVPHRLVGETVWCAATESRS